MAHRFTECKPWKGPIQGRNNGVLLSKNTEKTTGYSIDKLQDRGTFFVDPGEDVYAGQIIAEHIKPGDLVVNATEPKKLTNHRASGSDDASRIAPKTLMTRTNVWNISSRMNVLRLHQRTFVSVK